MRDVDDDGHCAGETWKTARISGIHSPPYTVTGKEEGLKKFTLYLITEWETQKDLERHLHTEKFGVLNGALEVCAQSQKSGTAILLKRGPKFPNPNLNPGKITRVNAS